LSFKWKIIETILVGTGIKQTDISDDNTVTFIEVCMKDDDT